MAGRIKSLLKLIFVAARRVFARGVFVLIQLTRNQAAKGIRRDLVGGCAPPRRWATIKHVSNRAGVWLIEVERKGART
jgi:hypothetical protein